MDFYSLWFPPQHSWYCLGLLADEDVMVKSEPVDMTDYYAASQIQVKNY